MTKYLDLSIGTCKMVWIHDAQSTILDERRYRFNLLHDTDSFLPHRGRLENADVTDSVKYPYLLLKEHIVDSHMMDKWTVV